MKIIDLIDEDIIILDLKAREKWGTLEEIIDKLDEANKLNNKQVFKEKIFKREEESTTGIGNSIAIPHAKTDGIKSSFVAFARSKQGIDFQSLDGKDTKLFFMIGVNEDENNEHIEILSKLASFLRDKDFVRDLLNASCKDEVLNIIQKKERVMDEKIESKAEEKKEVTSTILALTACPTGIAHTYIAAEALREKAKEMGVDIKVETNGSTGVKDRLSEEDIKQGKGIIIASDIQVPMDRFNGKTIIKTKTSEAIKDPETLIQRALNGEGYTYIKENRFRQRDEENTSIYNNLMNGVSNMLPFIIGGGILMALALLFDIDNIGSENYGSVNRIAAFLNDLGRISFGFIFPILSAYIAIAIGDRPALAPGFVAGALVSNGDAGFIGALFAGFLSGYVIIFLRKLFNKLPDSFEGIKPVLLFPIFGILIVGFIMNFIIIPPVEILNNEMNNFLNNLEGTNRVILGLILGGMMAVDMGGPINKAAYVFGVASVTEGNGHIMAAVMAGGMVPPLGIALGTSFFKKKFTQSEIDGGKANYIMGLSFITEGAIPFAVSDPKAVMPSIIIGSSLAGGLSEFFKVSSPAPHGGIFVFPVIVNWPAYLFSISIASMVTAILLNILKEDIEEKSIPN